MRVFIFEYEDAWTSERQSSWMIAENEQLVAKFLEPHRLVAVSEVPPEVASTNDLEHA